MFDAANLQQLTKDLRLPLNCYTDCFALSLCRNAKPICYIQKCQSCPNFENFSDYVTSVFNENDIDEVLFSVWKSTDRCTLSKECLTVDSFVTRLSDSLKKLIPHHFISKNQSKYIKDRKSALQDGEALLEMDFSENYAYVAQNAAQQFHYNNAQCTIHVAVLYYKTGQELKHRTFILLSDSLTHDTAAVYILQQRIIPEVKKMFRKLNRLIYVTDGAKQHYKNRFQMMNLVHHKQDFQINAEWHFHATAHGKGSCDGVGAVLKKEATRASLQANALEAILTFEDLFEWARNKLTTITFFRYSKTDHAKTQRFLAKRFSEAPSVTHISEGHSFIVTQDKELRVYRFSNSPETMAVVKY